MNLNFNDWLNESYEQKDTDRIDSLLRKAGGSTYKAVQLAETMAKSITDAQKAKRRGEAAEAQGETRVAQIFYNRANELGLKVTPKPVAKEEPATKEPDTVVEPDETNDTGAEETPEKKERKKRQLKVSVGDYCRITVDMIKTESVSLNLGNHWRKLISSKFNTSYELETGGGNKEKHYKGGGRHTSTTSEYFATLSEALLNKLDDDETIFYAKVITPGIKWIDAYLVYPNGFEFTHINNATIRFNVNDIHEALKELDIIKKESKSLESLNLQSSSGCAKFLAGDEETFDGTEFTPGVYKVFAIDYAATNDKNKLFVTCMLNRTQTTKKNVFSISAKDAIDAPQVLPKEKANVIADFISSQLHGANVTVKDNAMFEIPWFAISSQKAEGYLSAYNSSPYFTKELAQKHIDDLIEKAKDEKLPYSVENLEIKECESYSRYKVSFDQLIDYSKLMNIEFKMKTFLDEHRGSVTAQSFGI